MYGTDNKTDKKINNTKDKSLEGDQAFAKNWYVSSVAVCSFINLSIQNIKILLNNMC